MATTYMAEAKRAMQEGTPRQADPDKAAHIDAIAYALGQVAATVDKTRWAAELAKARAQLEQPEPPSTASVATQTEA